MTWMSSTFQHKLTDATYTKGKRDRGPTFPFRISELSRTCASPPPPHPFPPRRINMHRPHQPDHSINSKFNKCPVVPRGWSERDINYEIHIWSPRVRWLAIDGESLFMYESRRRWQAGSPAPDALWTWLAVNRRPFKYPMHPAPAMLQRIFTDSINQCRDFLTLRVPMWKFTINLFSDFRQVVLHSDGENDQDLCFFPRICQVAGRLRGKSTPLLSAGTLNVCDDNFRAENGEKSRSQTENWKHRTWKLFDLWMWKM